MDLSSSHHHDLTNFRKLKSWLDLKRSKYHDLKEFTKGRITYNSSFLPLPSIAWEIDPIQNRFLMLANKSIVIVDTFDTKHPDATLLPEELSPKRGIVKDLAWYPLDNSLSANISSNGIFSLIDMNRMTTADSFDIKVPSFCIKFDQSGQFPYCVSIGTKIGLRICDLKSGSQVHLLKTKFEVECIEQSPTNNFEIYTGLSDGKVFIWDLRKTAQSIREIQSPTKKEICVKQISHTNWSNGLIHVGYGDGNIFAFSSVIPEIESWKYMSVRNNTGMKMFSCTPFGEIVYPISGQIQFINSTTGELSGTSHADLLISPSSILMNYINNDIFVFDSNYIGTIFRYKPNEMIFDDDDENDEL